MAFKSGVAVPSLVRICLVVAISLLGVAAHARCEVPLADQNAGDDACAIVKWLYQLPLVPGKNHILSGQYGWEDSQKIHEITGRWPALYEDYLWQKGRSSWNIWPDAEQHRKNMKEHWDGGGLVSLHMPIPNPKNKSHQHDRDLTDEEFRDIALAGTALNHNYLMWLSMLANHLAWLQDHGVTVLIRPLHEMNHGGFWYGRRDPESYRKLFRLTVDYLTITSKLHNLIVVYSPNRGKRVKDYYPGDDYVDVVGVDTYHDPPLLLEDEYSQLKSFGKPFALTEVGWSANETIEMFTRDGSTDIIGAIKNVTPSAVWWSSWSRNNSPSRQIGSRKLYDDPAVMTRDEVDWRGRKRVPSVNQGGNSQITK